MWVDSHVDTGPPTSSGACHGKAGCGLEKQGAYLFNIKT